MNGIEYGKKGRPLIDVLFDDEAKKNQMKQPHHGRNGAQHVGRLRIRAAKILNDNFPDWDVRPEDIRPATGRWRTDFRMDVYRWELFSRLKRRNSHDGSELPVVCGCYDTLTNFVKEASVAGCHVTKHREINPGKE